MVSMAKRPASSWSKLLSVEKHEEVDKALARRDINNKPVRACYSWRTKLSPPLGP
jgi:hypothetical protein